MVKARLLAMAAVAGLGLGAIGAQPATAGVNVNVGVGGYWPGYGCGYYGCYHPRRPVYYDYDRPYPRPYYRPYYDDCRTVVVYKRRWNPYWGGWERIKDVRRTCN